jgi:hypothetical protein
MNRCLIIVLMLLSPDVTGRLMAADYAIQPSSLDHGGQLGSSAHYQAVFSHSPGAEGASSHYRLRAGFAGQLFDPDALPPVDFVSPGSLAADGSPKVFLAAAPNVDALALTYEGRDGTLYHSSATPPVNPGLYRVSASSLSQEYVGSAYRDFVISGPLAMPDSLTKPVNHSAISISLQKLLANDIRILPDGSKTSQGLTLTSVVPGIGNNVILGEEEDDGWIFFTPSNSTTDAFGYVISDGISTANGVVTVNALGVNPPFTLQFVRNGIPVYDGNQTSLAMDFIGVPGQNYQVEWSSDLITWHSSGTVPTGLTGSFTVSIIQAGNHVSEWKQRMFVRARR